MDLNDVMCPLNYLYVEYYSDPLGSFVYYSQYWLKITKAFGHIYFHLLNCQHMSVMVQSSNPNKQMIYYIKYKIIPLWLIIVMI